VALVAPAALVEVQPEQLVALAVQVVLAVQPVLSWLLVLMEQTPGLY
jgi:uncharacterized membrane protein